MNHMKSYGDYVSLSTESDENLVVGEKSNIAYSVLYRRKLIVGYHSFIDDHCYITCNLTVGNFVHISPFVYMIGGESNVVIGDYSGISSGTKLLCATSNFISGGLQHPAIPNVIRDSNAEIHEDIKIGRGVVLGLNNIVLPGVNIPDGVSTGVNVVITKNTKLEPWTYYDSTGRSVSRAKTQNAKQHIFYTVDDIKKLQQS